MAEDVAGEATFSARDIKIWSVSSTSNALRGTTLLTIEMLTPDDDEVVDGDYVSLDLPSGWCEMQSAMTITLSEKAVSGALTEVGNSIQSVSLCSVKVGMLETEGAARLKKN